jgi:hypothetical protein
MMRVMKKEGKYIIGLKWHSPSFLTLNALLKCFATGDNSSIEIFTNLSLFWPLAAL